MDESAELLVRCITAIIARLSHPRTDAADAIDQNVDFRLNKSRIACPLAVCLSVSLSVKQ